MVGITLSPEQINQAPPEVRRWLEQRISTTLGLYRPEPALQTPQPHLVGCDLESARSILSLMHGVLPGVSVFFELGREPVATSPRGLRALQLDTMARHAHLQSTEQVVACLQAINSTLQRVSGTEDAVLTVLDGSGHCLVADATARNVLALWQEIVAMHDLADSHRPLVQEVPYTAATPYSCDAVPDTLCDRDAAFHGRRTRRQFARLKRQRVQPVAPI
jgi:hypothetical protein